MKTIKIMLNHIDDIKNFIQAAQKVEGTILVKKNSYCVDGTSILGMLSLDLSQGVTVEYPEDATEFEQFIEKFC